MSKRSEITIDFESGVSALIEGQSLDWNSPSGIDPVCIILGSQCLNDCIFCRKVTAEQVPDVDCAQVACELKKVVESRKVRRLVMSGYEVLTFPGIVGLVEEARKMGFSEIEIMTSGNILGDGNFAKRLSEAGATHYLIPLYGPDAETHDRIVGKGGAFSRTVAGIREIKKLGAKAFVSSLALGQNLDCLDRLDSFVRQDLGCQFVFGPVRNKVNYRKVCPRLSDIGAKVKKAFAFGFPLCIPYFEGRDIEKFDISALVEKSLREAHNYMYFLYQPFRKLAGTCDRCALADRCPGILADYLDLFGKDKVKKELNPYGKK